MKSRRLIFALIRSPDHRHCRLLRPRRERPRSRRAAECSQQFPPSDGDCHPPLPREVRKWNDTTPRARSLPVQGGQDAGCCRPASGSKAERLSFPLCPGQRTYLPILELLPPPTLRERRHRGLARRLVACVGCPLCGGGGSGVGGGFGGLGDPRKNTRLGGFPTDSRITKFGLSRSPKPLPRQWTPPKAGPSKRKLKGVGLRDVF